MRLNLICPVIFAVAVFVSCTNIQEIKMEATLQAAGGNAASWETVLRHYEKEQPDALKLEAVRFLIANMNGHYSLHSEALEMFQDKIRHYSDTVVLNMQVVNRLWEESLKMGRNDADKRYDAETLSADFLIDNIEKAFAAWQASAWKNEVDWDTFCHYILPYRFRNEVLPSIGWRDSLCNEYYPLIAGVKDMKRAFAIIQDKVWKQVGNSSSNVPYIINVLDLKRQRRATCIQRCVLLGSILRAVGIPAAIDHVSRWANYSLTGHSWVVMVTDSGTYTVYEKDSIARRYNPVDASSFKVNEQARKDYPADEAFKKRCAKIGRTMYALQELPDKLDWDWELVPEFANSFRMDVSEAYGMNGDVFVPVPAQTAYAYLCCFATGKDWVPVAYAKIRKGVAPFENMGDSVVYLPAVYKDGRMQPVGQPFLWINGQKVSLSPDTTVMQRLVLNRKYPLTGNFLNTWTRFIGSRIEGSNYKDFREKELLDTLNTTPGFRTVITLKRPRTYRYFRIVVPESCKVPVTELEYWNEACRLSGIAFSEKVDYVERCFDGDTFTPLKINGEGYSIGVDFGRKKTVTHLIFYAKNDDNYIIPGNEYELFYYNMKWSSLGRKRADSFSLFYENVPSNALLLLKNRTKGKEERIFLYRQGKQVWL